MHQLAWQVPRASGGLSTSPCPPAMPLARALLLAAISGRTTFPSVLCSLSLEGCRWVSMAQAVCDDGRAGGDAPIGSAALHPTYRMSLPWLHLEAQLSMLYGFG